MFELTASVLDLRAPGQVPRLELPEIHGAVVSGKYGPGIQPAYAVRRAYMEAGLQVAFPRGDTPLEHYSGYTFSDEEEQYVPFPYMQDRFFDLIDENPFHTVVTGKSTLEAEVDGYMGFSTSHEVAYAILKAKPIILSSRIQNFSKYIPERLLKAVLKNQAKMIVEDPARLSSRELRQLVGNLPESVQYDITDEDAEEIIMRRGDLCNLEMHRWFSWTIQTEREYLSGLRDNWINEKSARFGIVPRPYLPSKELEEDESAKYYTDPAVYGSFMVHMHFPDFGK